MRWRERGGSGIEIMVGFVSKGERGWLRERAEGERISDHKCKMLMQEERRSRIMWGGRENV